jgi:hypothetical protein
MNYDREKYEWFPSPYYSGVSDFRAVSKKCPFDNRLCEIRLTDYGGTKPTPNDLGKQHQHDCRHGNIWQPPNSRPCCEKETIIYDKNGNWHFGYVKLDMSEGELARKEKTQEFIKKIPGTMRKYERKKKITKHKIKRKIVKKCRCK